MKRRLREAVRAHYPESVLPVDVVINPKKSLLRAEFCELSSEIERAFAIIQKSQNRLTNI
jgi:ribonuclease P protein component